MKVTDRLVGRVLYAQVTSTPSRQHYQLIEASGATMDDVLHHYTYINECGHATKRARERATLVDCPLVSFGYITIFTRSLFIYFVLYVASTTT